MGFSFEWIATDSTGLITNSEILDPSIINKFTIEKTVGDEFFIRSGDLSLEMKDHFPQVFGRQGWVAVWFEDFLFDVYKIIWNEYEEYNYKTKIYKARLPSFQSIVFEELRKIVIEYSTNSDEYNYYLGYAAFIVDKIKINPNLYLNNAYVFSLMDFLDCIVSGAKNGLGFSFNSLALDADFPTIDNNDDNVCAIYRGTSSASFSTAINKLGNGQLTWFNILELIQFTYNCFIRISPNISLSPRRLGGGIRITPRINFTPGSGIPDTEINYTELKRIIRKYTIDGVKITGGNFEYVYGAQSGAIFERSFNIYDPEKNQDATEAEERLFWSDADYDDGISKYKILDGSDNPKPYYKSGLLEEWYDGMITGGNGYEGQFIYELIYNGNWLINVLDLLDLNFETAMITKLIIDERNIASFDAIIIE